MRQRVLRAVAVTAMLGLLFAQLSLTAYACPLQNSDRPLAAPATAAMPDCADMAAAPAEANLCEVHCQIGAKAAPIAAGDVPPYLAPLIVSAATEAQLPRAGRIATADVHAALAAGPPLAIRFCRFLI